MKSMTGFGSGDAAAPSGRLIVELRSVNHRFLDVRVRAAREVLDVAPLLEQLAREHVLRGRLDIAIRLEATQEQVVGFDLARARALYQSLCQLRDDVAPGTEVPFTALAAFADWLQPGSLGDGDALREATQQAFREALRSLNEMRASEGQSLARDLRARLQTLRAYVADVQLRLPQLVAAQLQKLQQRVQKLLPPNAVVDAARLELEIAIVADKSDVAEEITRFIAHCDHFDQLLDRAEPIGKKLDFLLQEMAREINTLSAKSQDTTIAHTVVAAKSELERVREQVANVE